MNAEVSCLDLPHFEEAMNIFIKKVTISIILIGNLQLAHSSDNLPQRDNDDLIILQMKDRADTLQTDINWDELLKAGLERRNKVIELLNANQIKTTYDYWRAAMIFQHGDGPSDFRLAFSFANIANTLNSDEQTRWLVAASWDRLLNSLGRPQWYGTQSIPSKDGKYWLLVDIDEKAVTDEERMFYTNKRIKDLSLSEPRERKIGQPDTLPDGYFSKIYSPNERH